MIPRGKLDIGFGAIVKGLQLCAKAGATSNLAEGSQLHCLSVRTGLHLLLTALQLPSGADVLVTGINIPDMFSIIEAHGLQPVALLVQRDTLAIDPEDLRKAITRGARVLLITHLFGAVMKTDELVSIAKAHNLFVIEDCAQAFGAVLPKDPFNGDAAMFSFGLIKTHTALGGAVLVLKDDTLITRLIDLNKRLPIQSQSVLAKKLSKASVIKLMTSGVIYSGLYRSTRMLHKDFDEVLSDFTRGFPGTDVLAKVQFRLSAAHERFLKWRLANFNYSKINKRSQLAADITSKLPTQMRVGSSVTQHSHWVLPINSSDPHRLIALLRQQGFDATQKASSLVHYGNRTIFSDAELQLHQLVYLPLDANVSSRDYSRLVKLLNDFG